MAVTYWSSGHLKHGNSFPAARFSPCTKLSFPLPSKEPREQVLCPLTGAPGPSSCEEEVAEVRRDSVEARQQAPRIGVEELQVRPHLLVATFLRSKAGWSRNNNAHGQHRQHFMFLFNRLWELHAFCCSHHPATVTPLVDRARLTVRKHLSASGSPPPWLLTCLCLYTAVGPYQSLPPRLPTDCR